MKIAREGKECSNKRYKICANGPPIIRHIHFNRKELMKKTKEKIFPSEFEEFVCCHGMADNNDYVNYHISLGFYYAYFARAMQCAAAIDGEEVFG